MARAVGQQNIGTAKKQYSETVFDATAYIYRFWQHIKRKNSGGLFAFHSNIQRDVEGSLWKRTED